MHLNKQCSLTYVCIEGSGNSWTERKGSCRWRSEGRTTYLSKRVCPFSLESSEQVLLLLLFFGVSMGYLYRICPGQALVVWNHAFLCCECVGSCASGTQIWTNPPRLFSSLCKAKADWANSTLCQPALWDNFVGFAQFPRIFLSVSYPEFESWLIRANLLCAKIVDIQTSYGRLKERVSASSFELSSRLQQLENLKQQIVEVCGLFPSGTVGTSDKTSSILFLNWCEVSLELTLGLEYWLTVTRALGSWSVCACWTSSRTRKSAGKIARGLSASLIHIIPAWRGCCS